MKIRIFVNPSRLRQWHLALADRLAQTGHIVALAFAEGGATLPAGLALLMAIERKLYRLPADHPSQRPRFEAVTHLAVDMADADLLIDLTVIGAAVGSAADAAGHRPIPLLRLLFNGLPSEIEAMNAIIDGRVPHIAIQGHDGQIIASGRPAIRTPHVMACALDAVFTESIDVISGAIDGVANSSTLESHVAMTFPRRALRGRAWAFAIRSISLGVRERVGFGRTHRT